MQLLAQEVKHQDIFTQIQGDPHLSQLQRHVFQELVHGQPFLFSLVRDDLTGFLQRSTLLECLVQALADAQLRNKHLAVCFIDLDGFKEINDQYGHIIGDQTLGLVGACLKNSIRSADLLCRWGGDEFVVVLQDIDHRDSILVLVKRLLNAISTPLKLSAHEPLTIFLGASIGVTVVEPKNSHQNSNALALVEAADKAMYCAKKAGKNRIQFAV
jgi:diguanylate cyclase (GGDEF)-like protein